MRNAHIVPCRIAAITRPMSIWPCRTTLASGALVGWGIPEERVKHYESGIKQGGIVMGVKPRSEQDSKYFSEEWKKHKGEHVYP